MNYETYTLDTLNKLGIRKFLRGSEYIVFGIEYLFSLNQYTIPESGMIYNDAAQKFFLSPTAIENSMRNTIQTIWTNKENPELMTKIFGSYNLSKRPCNMEFLMLLYNYIRICSENSTNLKRLNDIWEESKKYHLIKNKSHSI